MYHFLVESKPHERVDLLMKQVSIFTRQKKKKSIPIVMKTCLSEGKLMKEFGNPLFQLTPPPPPHPPPMSWFVASLASHFLLF